MIHEGLIKSTAGRLGVDPMTVELDYVQGVVLSAFASTSAALAPLVFKGGTCLRKAYFADYRFSEDLDFTSVGLCSKQALRDMIGGVAQLTGQHGVALLVADTTTERSGPAEASAIEMKVPFRGPIQRTGNPRNLRFHVDTSENLAFPVAQRALLHPYPDADELSCVLPCYALEEMMVEKLRAVCGQRRFAIARDVYDIWRLRVLPPPPEEPPIDWGAVGPALRAKAAAKGVDLDSCRSRLISRAEEYRSNWHSAVAPLVPAHAEAFDQAWETVLEILLGMDIG
jgi:predicted nucleotidyltransferase component of viral defense system